MDLDVIMSYLPHVDVLMGFLCILLIGVVIGAVCYLPVAHYESKIPLEKLTNDIVWKYLPDWILLLAGCIALVVLCFLLLGGIWRI